MQIRKKNAPSRRRRSHWRKCSPFHLVAESLEPRIVLDSTVVFNEIMYNPAGADDAKLEFIELHNQLAVNIDISEWKLAGGVEFEFPDQTIVPGRSQLIVAADPKAFQNETGISNALGPWQGRLSNGGEELRLFNNDERLMNIVNYDDGGEWPDAADGGGVSLAKMDQQSGSHLSENWTFSRELGGTPGQHNFIPEGTLEPHDILAESSPVSAFVPIDDSLELNWVSSEFDDSSWLQGTTGVGFDTKDDYNEFFGLDLDDPPNGQPPMTMIDVNASVYIRIPFQIDQDIASFERLEMLLRFEDGFVAYLNGVEWTSFNAPGRDGDDGELTWNSVAAGSHRDQSAMEPVRFDLLPARDSLRMGENMLAIHLMNRRISDSDLLFQPTIIGFTEIIPEKINPLKLNEVAGFGDEFFVEVINHGSTAEDLSGLVLKTPESDSQFVWSDGVLQPGERLAINSDQLPLSPIKGDQIQLFSPDSRTLIDARKVSDRLEGFNEASGVWQYPTSPTPGEVNVFDVNRDIVINEIMYHAPTKPGFLKTPELFARTELLPFETVWRYNQSGIDLGPDWFNTVYAVDNQHWFQGPAPIGFSSEPLNPAIETELISPRDNNPRFVTHYFQTEFEVTVDELDRADIIEITHFIDDGAIFYLNGQEVARYNMDDGDANFETTSSSPELGTPFLVGPVNLPNDVLHVGTNIFSIEVHQAQLRSRDIAMGIRLGAGEQIAEAVPGQLAQQNDEEWIEFYNRGSAVIDVTGWKIADAVNFEFANGTTIGPGEYLIVARDRDALKTKFPDIRIVGNYRGSLGNRDDHIQLIDPAGNLVDDVHYFEGGYWPVSADGSGTSLELRNPFTDNSNATSWSVSDNSEQSEWVSHVRRGVADIDVSGASVEFHEFIFGMLGSSEVLIDDIRVVQDPDGAAISLIQNGTFEQDNVGEVPEKWRIIGNHSGKVVIDPTDPNNQALKITAAGSQQHVHDHAETTFSNGMLIFPGMEYEISFRAKWLQGSSQLNSRFYFNRIADTLNLHVPDRLGTPGRVNSSFEINVGPTFEDFEHSRSMPKAGEPVTISVRADDPDDVKEVQLWWRKDGGSWQQSPMMKGHGTYQAEIPGHDTATIVQFYVEATDMLGNSASYPPAGRDSRALFKVADGQGPLSNIDTFRIVIMQDDLNRLYERTNRMSNWIIPFTLLHNSTSFYDVGLRQVGSRWVRPDSGYKVRLNPEQPFYGVHDSIRFDLNGLPEIVMKQMINRAGGAKTSMYDDIAFLVVPPTTVANVLDHSHEILLNLARLENVYLNEQFDNGSSGTKWELDDVVYPSNPIDGNPEGLKRETKATTMADIGLNADITYLQGNDPEFYRPHLILKNRRVEDRFDTIQAFAHAIHSPGDELFAATNEVMDVDRWMRHYANQAYFGNEDTWGLGRPKNLRIYQRPSDDKIIPFFWDCDLCDFKLPLYAPDPDSRLDEIRDIPHNLRLFWGHMLDYMNRSFTAEYVSTWANHYGELANFKTFGGDETFGEIAESTRLRTESAQAEIRERIPEVDFQITTENGQEINPDEASITLEGIGWVNVRKIRRADSGVELEAFWPTINTWQIQVPLNLGENQITLEAFDFAGNLLATDTVNVVSTAENPAVDSLRISELHYNPGEPNQIELDAGFSNNEFEFIEFVNIGSATISLDRVRLVKVDINGDEHGLDFSFDNSAVTSLAPGERVVVVENIDAFRLRYGDIVNVAGQWSGGLGNRSETVTVMAGGTLLQQFTYQDQWYPITDGGGSSLVIANLNGDLTRWNQPEGWSPSGIEGGSPGEDFGRPGDSNGDGIFNSKDLIFVFEAGEYEDAVDGNSTFAEGDWNGDGDFTSSDFVLAFIIGGYTFAAEMRIEQPLLGSAVDALVYAETDSAPPMGSFPQIQLNQVQNEFNMAGSEWTLEQTTVETLFKARHSMSTDRIQGNKKVDWIDSVFANDQIELKIA